MLRLPNILPDDVDELSGPPGRLPSIPAKSFEASVSAILPPGAEGSPQPCSVISVRCCSPHVPTPLKLCDDRPDALGQRLPGKRSTVRDHFTIDTCLLELAPSKLQYRN